MGKKQQVQIMQQPRSAVYVRKRRLVQKTKNVNVDKFFIYGLNKRIDNIKDHRRNNYFLYAMKKKKNSS
jgi:hypothetical protein